jgi:ECF sigma factor
LLAVTRSVIFRREHVRSRSCPRAVWPPIVARSVVFRWEHVRAPVIRLARAGDEAAAASLTRAYEPFIRRFVQFRMRRRSDHDRLQPEVDTVDICQSVFKSLFVGLRGGRFELAGPEQLQKLLAAMVRFKVATKARRLSLFRPLSWNLQVVHALRPSRWPIIRRRTAEFPMSN